MPISYILKQIFARKLRRLQRKSGLFSASKRNSLNGYDKAWIRDNIYEALGLEEVKDYKLAQKTLHAIFNLMLKHEDKINKVLKNKPENSNDYIHPRYCPLTLNELPGDWGNKQNDSIGAFLFLVGKFENKGIPVIRDINDLHILQKLVSYLEKIEYWSDKDNGMWEELDEIHASSIGACVAGLKQISQMVSVNTEIIIKGQDALNQLLPRESDTKDVDLSLLSLIYPYNIISKVQADQILQNIETKLVRKKGVIRYVGDKYYSNGNEAEWCFGFPWLAKIYKDKGNTKKYLYYLLKTYSTLTIKGDMPELYFANSKNYNENTPLGWGLAMCIVAV